MLTRASKHCTRTQTRRCARASAAPMLAHVMRAPAQRETRSALARCRGPHPTRHSGSGWMGPMQNKHRRRAVAECTSAAPARKSQFFSARLKIATVRPSSQTHLGSSSSKIQTRQRPCSTQHTLWPGAPAHEMGQSQLENRNFAGVVWQLQIETCSLFLIPIIVIVLCDSVSVCCETEQFWTQGPAKFKTEGNGLFTQPHKEPVLHKLLFCEVPRGSSIHLSCPRNTVVTRRKPCPSQSFRGGHHTKWPWFCRTQGPFGWRSEVKTSAAAAAASECRPLGQTALPSKLGGWNGTLRPNAVAKTFAGRIRLRSPPTLAG